MNTSTQRHPEEEEILIANELLAQLGGALVKAHPTLSTSTLLGVFACVINSTIKLSTEARANLGMAYFRVGSPQPAPSAKAGGER